MYVPSNDLCCSWNSKNIYESWKARYFGVDYSKWTHRTKQRLKFEVQDHLSQGWINQQLPQKIAGWAVLILISWGRDSTLLLKVILLHIWNYDLLTFSLFSINFYNFTTITTLTNSQIKFHQYFSYNIPHPLL